MLALVGIPKNADIKTRDERPTDVEGEDQRVNSKSKRSKQRDQVWGLNQEILGQDLS